MAKIGRNERCPCGSGKKYKHCCSRRPAAAQAPKTADEQLRISLLAAVEQVCQAAELKKGVIKDLGVFVLFSTTAGNAWLFEVTQADCVQVARDGAPLPAPIDENPKTIEIDWSHTYRVRDRKMMLKAYADKQEFVLEDCPVKEVSALIRRISKKIPPEMLSQLHVDPEQVESL